jgi:hypothetical protein
MPLRPVFDFVPRFVGVVHDFYNVVIRVLWVSKEYCEHIPRLRVGDFGDGHFGRDFGVEGMDWRLVGFSGK